VLEDVEQIGTADVREPMIPVIAAVAGIVPPVLGEKVEIRLSCFHLYGYPAMSGSGDVASVDADTEGMMENQSNHLPTRLCNS